MTANQIAYWNYRENQRANQAREHENERSNKAKERETERSNRANESLKDWSNQETRRSNIAKEGETYRSNRVKELETQRHNIVEEDIGSQQAYSSLVKSQADALKTGLLNWGLANVGAVQAREESRGNSFAAETIKLVNTYTKPSTYWKLGGSHIPGSRSGKY